MSKGKDNNPGIPPLPPSSSPEEGGRKKRGKRRFRPLRILIIVLVALLVLILVALQIVLNSEFLKQTVRTFAADYIQGETLIGDIDVSIFSTFPYVDVKLEDVAITYPHERFAEFDSLYFPSPLRSEGEGGSGVDTLASIGKAHLRLNYMAALQGNIALQKIHVSSVRAFVHNFSPGTSNLDIIQRKQSGKPRPKVILRDIRVDKNPHIVYTSPCDTLFVSLDPGELTYDGKLDISDLSRLRGTLRLQSLQASGRLPSMEGQVRVDELSVSEKRKAYDILLKADADVGIARIGTLNIPLSLKSQVAFPTPGSFTELSLRDLSLKAAMLTLEGEADLKLGEDSTYVRAEISMEKCPLAEVISQYARKFAPAIGKVRTNAVIDLLVMCDGYWIPAQGALPELIGQLKIPRSNLAFDDISYTGVIAADIEAMTDSYGKLTVDAQELDINVAGAHLRGNASAEDVLGGDPLIDAALSADVNLDRISTFLPEGMSASGKASAEVEGMLLLSDLSISNFALADVEGKITSEGFSFRDEPDSVNASLSGVGIELRHYEEPDGRSRALGIFGSIDTLSASIGKNLAASASTVGLTLQNGHELVSQVWDKEVHPLTGTLSAGSVDVSSGPLMRVGLSSAVNHFKYSARESAPLLYLNSSFGGIGYDSSPNMARIGPTRVEASAVMNGVIRRQRRDRMLDSLQKIYPSIQRDSLMRMAMPGGRTSRRGLAPQSDDFTSTSKDIEIQLQGSLLQMYRDWDLSGKISSTQGTLSLPEAVSNDSFFRNLSCSLTNDTVNIDSLSLYNGKSDISLSGGLEGLRGAILMKLPLDLDLDIKSDRIDVNELMASLRKGDTMENTAETDSTLVASTDSLGSEPVKKNPLFVLPRNINATVRVEGNEIDYSSLIIDWFSTELRLQDRCLQATNTVATSNVGDIYFEGFYATRSKKDITGTFDLNLVDITAEKVIDLIPSVDKVIPMLKSFKGKLDCEMAASTQLDTNMRIIQPSLKGLVSIKGSDLSLDFPQEMQKITRLLMFKDKTSAHVDEMKIQGLISDNSLEIFPFILALDRYELALSGTQNFDQSFRYHASVLQSILNFTLGIDFYGNFDNWKYSLVRPKYKRGALPDYSSRLTEMQYGILDIIHNVFDDASAMAMQRNMMEQDALRESVSREGGTPSEALSKEETERLQSLGGEGDSSSATSSSDTGHLSGEGPSTSASVVSKTRCQEKWDRIKEAVRESCPARFIREQREKCRLRREEKRKRKESTEDPATSQSAALQETASTGEQENTTPQPNVQ